MIRFLAVFSLILLLQISTVRASESFTTNPKLILCAANATPTAASSSISAVPLDKYLKNNGFNPKNIVQVVPLPPGKPVQTGGAASIAAVPLKDYANDNGFNPDKIKQYVPIPPEQTGKTAPVCPKSPQYKQIPSTGGAASPGKIVRGYW